MDLATRVGLYVLFVASLLLFLLFLAYVAIQVGRVRAKRQLRARRLLASPSSSSACLSGSDSGEPVVVVPVLPHPEGQTSPGEMIGSPT